MILNDRKRSQRQEKSVAKKFKGSLTVGSGSKWFSKGDVRTDKFLIECKTTFKDYYTLTSKVWEKIEREADLDGMRIPLMVIDLIDRDRVVVFKTKYFGLETLDLNPKPVKSARITASALGKDEFGDYTYSYSVTICGKQRNILTCMLLEDFIRDFWEE